MTNALQIAVTVLLGLWFVAIVAAYFAAGGFHREW